MDLLAEFRLANLMLNRPVEAFTDATGLRLTRIDFIVIDVLNSKTGLIFLMLTVPTYSVAWSVKMCSKDPGLPPRTGELCR
jgi:hypothetical protein